MAPCLLLHGHVLLAWRFIFILLVFLSELSAAAARPQPAWRHHQVRLHGQEGDQQAAQTEGEEERVAEGRSATGS